MIIKLTPAQIGNDWQYIKRAVLDALPPQFKGVQLSESHVLSALTSGALQLFVFLDGLSKKVRCVFTVEQRTDYLSQLRIMNVCTFYGLNAIKPSDMDEMFEYMKNYAKTQRCNKLTFFTPNTGLKKLAERYGANNVTMLISIPIEAANENLP